MFPKQRVCVLVIVVAVITYTIITHLFLVDSNPMGFSLGHQHTSTKEDVNPLTCVDPTAAQFGRVEDLFCTKLGKFEPQFKNPCFYQTGESGERKSLRCLPYFYILGPDKCGTTDLYSRLVNHTQIVRNAGEYKKECSFWSWKRYGTHNFEPWRRNETIDFYLQCFDTTAQSLEADKSSHNTVTVDASPMDFYDFFGWPLIPQNRDRRQPRVLNPALIRHLYGDRGPKMIVQLRNPVERVFSLYVFLGYSNNPIRFHYDVIASMDALRRCVAEKGRRWCFFDGELFRNMTVKLATSCYSVFLKEWLSPFPRSSFFITRLEDTSTNMKQTLMDIYSFLELDPLPEGKLNILSDRSKKHITRSKVGIHILPKTAEILKEFYQPCNEELSTMLNDDRFLWSDSPL